MRVALVAILVSVFVNAAYCSTYENPLIEGNHPDPGVIYATDTYFVTTTSFNDSNHFPIFVSDALVSWKLGGYIFAEGKGPGWAVGDFWAPEIHFGFGEYVAYFAARDRTGIMCVGVARGGPTEAPLTPFVDAGMPLIRNESVGSIDPHLFYDDDTPGAWLLWKSDGNALHPPQTTTIWAQQLGCELFCLMGEAVPLISNTLAWEGLIVEAPWMVKRGSYYYLFYSANVCGNASYAVGVARGPTVTGPFEKHPTPILHSNSHFAGPGHVSVVQGHTLVDDVLFYHAWEEPYVGPGHTRRLMMDRLLWGADGWPSVKTDSPSVGPQPIP